MLSCLGRLWPFLPNLAIGRQSFPATSEFTALDKVAAFSHITQEQHLRHQRWQNSRIFAATAATRRRRCAVNARTSGTAPRSVSKRTGKSSLVFTAPGQLELNEGRAAHKLLCKTFADFKERPKPHFVRTIALPVEGDKPRFVWLPTGTYSVHSEAPVA